MRYLNKTNLPLFLAVIRQAAEARGLGFYEWKNAPTVNDSGGITHSAGGQTRDVSMAEAFEIWKAKLDCAYAQRFLLMVAFVVAAVNKGMEVAMIQFKDERQETAFDPEGWVTFSFNGFTNFHVSPDDLPTAHLAEAGFINFLASDSEEGKKHGYHGKSKLERLFLPIEQMLS